MNQIAAGQVSDAALAAGEETQQMAVPHRSEIAPLDSIACNPIVQCLLIAARRGRQIRLAREQAAQLQQGGSGSVEEETSLANEL